MPPIYWYDLAEGLGTITETATGWSESGGTRIATQALTQIVGDEALRDAVDYYVSRQPGSEMAKSVLQLLKPPSAMDRCHEIFLASEDDDDVSLAINLLQYVADPRVLGRIPYTWRAITTAPDIGVSASSTSLFRSGESNWRRRCQC